MEPHYEVPLWLYPDEELASQPTRVYHADGHPGVPMMSLHTWCARSVFDESTNGAPGPANSSTTAAIWRLRSELSSRQAPAEGAPASQVVGDGFVDEVSLAHLLQPFAAPTHLIRGPLFNAR